MKSLILSLLPAVLLAAPATELASEWVVPLESAPGFVLVDKVTGQFTVHTFSESNVHVETGPFQSELTEVTGVSTGWGDDQLGLASESTNAVRFISLNGSSPVTLQTVEPGPAAVVPLRNALLHPETALVQCTFASPGEKFELWANPRINGTRTGVFDLSEGLISLQGYRVPNSIQREALGIRGASLFRYRRQLASVNETELGDVNPGSRLAAEITGTDDRACAIAWLPEKLAAQIVTLPFGGFATGVVTSNDLPFAIGTIAGRGDDGGVLITAANGSSAVIAEVINGATFNILETITASDGNSLTGLVNVPGLGVLALEGNGVSRDWRLFRNSGDGWQEVAKGSFASWNPGLTSFATLFWFSSSPLLMPDASLLALESQAQWTTRNGAGNIPASVGLAELGTPEMGLVSTGSQATSPPTGAGYLMTNQFTPDVSVSALGSTLAVSRPALDIEPASGTYGEGVVIVPRFSESSADLFMRRGNGAWMPFTDLTIGYPSTWHFYARDKLSGATSAIVTRTYDFPLDLLNSIDSDGDTVPDYVELENGLNPNGGNDQDGDFQSDLEELFGGSLPTDGTDSLTEDQRQTLFQGEGFLMNVLLRKTKTAEAGLNVGIRLHGMTGALLDEQETENVDGEALARFNVAMAVAGNDWVVLSSPTYFEDNGRETFRVLQRPVNAPVVIEHQPTGNNRQADAAAWLTAAMQAQQNYQAATETTELTRLDTLIAALAEEALRQSLNLPELTLFSFRDGESSTPAFSDDLKAQLLRDGWDFPGMLALIDATVRASTALDAFVDEVYDLHVAESSSAPFMLLPLDAFRSVIRTGTISHPSGENPYAGVETEDIGNAITELLAQIPGTRRPVETWTLTIEEPTTPLHNFDYRRVGNDALAWLVDRLGRRTQLEQGLGLVLGTTFTVTGYTDVSGPEGFDVMEVLTLDAVVTPLPSDQDTNANLLDDDWERFFFGALGVVDPFDPHPITGHSYLQYHLEGEDPRSGSLVGPILILIPQNIQLQLEDDLLKFEFPDEALAFIDLCLGYSDDLQNFDDLGVPVQSQGNNTHCFAIPTDLTDEPEGFFRIGLKMK